MRTNKGFSYIELALIIAVLGLLAVVAIPRHVDAPRRSMSEFHEEASIKYVSSLHDSLAAHVEDHNMRGTKWVDNGEEIMAFLDEGLRMPASMQYANNVWIDNETGFKWKFMPAENKSTPRIKRLPPKSQQKISD